ncbi:uncharacterized protein ACMZJ9_015398 [Mantella aurantiaca]
MKLSRLDPNEPLGADQERSHMIERIVSLTLDILYLLTGEDYIVLKMSYGRVTHSSSPCVTGGFGRSPTLKLTSERNNDQKILEVTRKMIGLLTGEVPIRTPIKKKRSRSKLVKEEEDDEDGSNTPERCPRPLYSRDGEEKGPNNVMTKNVSQNTVTPCLKKETDATEPAPSARKRGRPRKRRIPEAAPSHHSTPGSEDTSEARKAMAAEDDQQQEVTKDLHTGWIQDRLASVSVIEVEEDEDDGEEEESLNHIYKSKRWPPPDEAALSAATGDEDSGESPSKDSGWEISEDGSEHSMASNGAGPSRDNSSEGGIIKVSLDDVQEAAERAESIARRGAKRKTFTCLDCGRCFASLEQLESHHKVHSGEAPFCCAACGSSFASPEELGEHVGLHAAEKMFACSLCGKCFAIKANLIAHRRVHTGDKPFACAECGRRFALRSSLETHLPVHAVEKPYPCSLCGKCFATSGRLAVHQTTHAGDKTYECEDCGKIFTTSSSMNRHRRTHTGEKPYCCMMCGKCFNRETNLYRHQMIHRR